MKLNRLIVKKLKGRFPGREAVRENLKLLYAGTDGSKEEELYYIEKVNLLLKVLAAGLCMVFLAEMMALVNRNLIDGYFLPRKERVYRQELRVIWEDGDPEDMIIQVEPQRLSGVESRKALEQAVEQMETYILGENVSVQEVRHDLKLIRQVEG